jgi:hypothetical protein
MQTRRDICRAEFLVALTRGLTRSESAEALRYHAAAEGLSLHAAALAALTPEPTDEVLVARSSRRRIRPAVGTGAPSGRSPRSERRPPSALPCPPRAEGDTVADPPGVPLTLVRSAADLPTGCRPSAESPRSRARHDPVRAAKPVRAE